MSAVRPERSPSHDAEVNELPLTAQAVSLPLFATSRQRPGRADFRGDLGSAETASLATRQTDIAARAARWLLLDGSGVVFTMRHEQRLHALAARCDTTGEERIHQVIWGSGFDSLVDWGYFGEYDILSELKTECGYSGALEDLCADWCEGFALNEELLDLVEGWSKQAQIAILSDNGPLLCQSIERRYPRLHRLCRHIVFSCDIGACKPAAFAFGRAAQILGAAPQDIFFIDDLVSNCRAAEALGFCAHTYLGPDELQGSVRPFLEG